MTTNDNGIDRFTERAARWLASRTTRRGLLANAGKAALVLTGGGAIAGLLAERASARVCGQSGISPICPTYDCAGPGFVWGWCWYASPGCCADGGLKKICDCCKSGFANVHGYCPDGTNVYCATESCLEDPRVQTVLVDWTELSDASAAALRFSQYRPAGSASTVVVGNPVEPLWAAVAIPVAVEFGVPLLFSGPGTAEELVRLGATTVIGVGPVAEATERLTSATDVAVASVEVGAWLLARTGRSTVWLSGADATAVGTAAAAGADAARRGMPLVIGMDAVGALQEAMARPLDRLSAPASAAAEPMAVSLDVASRVLDSQGGAVRLGVAAIGSSSGSVVGPGGPVVVVDGGLVGLPTVLRDWLIAHRGRFHAVDVVGLSFSLVKDVQSAVNGYDTHRLVGVAGQGLPVYVQPVGERAPGAVRVSGPLPSTTTTKPRKGSSAPAPTYPTPAPVTTQPVPTTVPAASATTTVPTTSIPVPPAVPTSSGPTVPTIPIPKAK